MYHGSSWGSRTAEFAIYLFLITLFPDSLLPASIFGFLTTGSAIVLSGWAGHQVDTRNNLRLVRFCIVTVKLSACGAYAASLVLFYRIVNQPFAQEWSTPLGAAMFALIVICGCIQNLSAVTLSVAVERDWVTTIAQASSEHLTRINTYMRRIDLLCKLLAPLFVSLLVTAASNVAAAYILCGVEAGCIVFELLCKHWVVVRPHESAEYSMQGSTSSTNVFPLCRQHKPKRTSTNKDKHGSGADRRHTAISNMLRNPYGCIFATVCLTGESSPNIRYFCLRSQSRVFTSPSSVLTAS